MTEFEHAGLRCKVVQTSMGHHCGYVAVPPSHPWHGLHYSAKVSVPQSVIEREIGENDVCIISLICQSEPVKAEACPIDLAISIHGGMTYAAKDHSDDHWWFGFDCAHYGDGRREGDDGWKDEAFAAAECRRLADQLAIFSTEAA